MAITLIKNKEIKLNIPSFTCDDNPIGEHLNSHPLSKLLNVYGFLSVIGRPGSGKTSFSISLITQSKPKIYNKCFHHNIIVMPAQSIASLQKNPFKDLDNVFNECNDETIGQIYEKITTYSGKDEKTLLFIDDMTADLKKTKFIIDTLKRLIYNRRHLKLNIIITAQSFSNIPLDLRKNIQNMVMFRPSKKELQLVFEELVESKRDMFERVMRYTYDNPHNFLFINVPSQRLFKNFDELILNDSDAAELIVE